MPKKKKTNRLPRVLILEGLGGSSKCVRAAGAEIIELRPTLDNAARIESEPWDALLLTGGSDVDPRLYGQKPDKTVYGINENRDTVEIAALEEARRRNVPVLGICRGAQMINVEAGGTLVQHIRGHRGGRHHLLTREKSLMRRAAPQQNKLVNSYHHQMVRKPASGFVISAIAPDKTVEAIESKDGRVLGVQFHPEMCFGAAWSRSIFRWLIEEASERANLVVPGACYDSGLLEEQLEIDFEFEDDDSVVTVSKKRGKHRRAGSKTRSRYPSMVTVSWVCPRCGIVFDHLKDREDHVHSFHK
jgi:putative glutamine amidotransferase